MTDTNILKTDSRGRITLPSPFRTESLFGYVVEGNQLTLYPVRTIRKYPDMSEIPSEELSQKWASQEEGVNMDDRSAIPAKTASAALKKLRK